MRNIGEMIIEVSKDRMIELVKEITGGKKIMNTEDLMREYVRLRIDTYIENMIPKQRIKDTEEIKLYDNVKEALSMIDYCFIRLDLTTDGKRKTMEEIHKRNIKKIIEQGNYKVL